MSKVATFDLRAWLIDIDESLGQYAECLDGEGFDSLKALATLTRDACLALGITKIGHLNLILTAANPKPMAGIPLLLSFPLLSSFLSSPHSSLKEQPTTRLI